MPSTEPAPATELSHTSTPSLQPVSEVDGSPTTKTKSKGKGNKAAKAQEMSQDAGEKKLTPAELKKKAKEEKAARRAEAVLKKHEDATATYPEPSRAASSTEVNADDIPSLQHNNPKGAATQQRTRGPVLTGGKNALAKGAQPEVMPTVVIPKKEDKTVELFRHLYRKRVTTIAMANKDVHPAMLALGMQNKSYQICGSRARLVAMLEVFKRIIESYTTPAGNTLTRHLTPHVLSPNIEYLTSCRPISISMGNAIRWLKLTISQVDIDTPESEAKQNLCAAIDTFLRERVTFASGLIADAAAARIQDGDMIMTYAKSSVVQEALVRAFNEGKRFKVIVVDSRPLHEGKNLATALANIGMEVQYCLLNGLSHNIGSVTKVFLGAHAMMSNGRLFSRVGTALVAMEAKDADKPVIVLCETVKFTERVALDSFVHNEIAQPDELIAPGGALEGWEDVKKLQICNLMYDVTPPEYIHAIVTESCSVPTTSVPVLHRMGNESQA